MVHEIDVPYDNPNLIVDLSDGMYTVNIFTVGSTEPIQIIRLEWGYFHTGINMID